jgi:DNA repair exonuclease SbcCD ATPase subunit
MLYLAQVQKHKSLPQPQLRLLARQEAEHTWAAIQTAEAFIPLPEGLAFSEGVLILVQLSPKGELESLENAINWVMDLVQDYLIAGITPEFFQKEAERAEEWRKSLTLQSQDLARRTLELEARREQLQAFEERLNREKEEMEAQKKRLQELEATMQSLKAELEELKAQQKPLPNPEDTFHPEKDDNHKPEHPESET